MSEKTTVLVEDSIPSILVNNGQRIMVFLKEVSLETVVNVKRNILTGTFEVDRDLFNEESHWPFSLGFDWGEKFYLVDNCHWLSINPVASKYPHLRVEFTGTISSVTTDEPPVYLKETSPGLLPQKKTKRVTTDLSNKRVKKVLAAAKRKKI